MSKSLVQVIESTLPQLLDGFANINIPACLIQYHYYLLLISCCQKVTLQLNQQSIYCRVQTPFFFLSTWGSLHLNQGFPDSL